MKNTLIMWHQFSAVLLLEMGPTQELVTLNFLKLKGGWS